MKTKDQKTIRAFIAVRIPLDLAATLHKKAQHRAGDVLQHKLRWMVPQQQHITLRFLGECDEHSLEQFSNYIEESLENVRGFDCMTGCFEFFPDAHRPRALALNIHSGQQLNALSRICEEGARMCGMRREMRNFRPHVTLARFRQHHHVTHSHFFNMPSYRMTVNEVVLMKSETTAEGAQYSVMKVFPLQPLAKTA
ncbi:RNA 2',3'-cyclic phosphodiesterase [Endozoicomonas arenosclerae]|uniref:RNA 2',3'-cyclic phosphodiesterase n=1 Tax=Endozoicomonas arenosclerae TaxID=1633495 RepID=UPI000780856E|nr:RNA 2',3'-cyclic phosphodiesterase [Endozoicomonas arenosclerae]